ncbi:MAG: reverse transcriptase domain-containing protein [Candidatus Tectimicrobiota bacterium]
MRTLSPGSYQRLSSLEALWRAWRACRRGKRRNPTVAYFDLDWDTHLLALHRALRAQTYRPAAWRLHVISDPKVRLIAAPAVRDRVVQHAVLQEIGPVFERSYLAQSFATGQQRGPHRAVLAFLQCQRRYQWRLHLDISAYFLSISHARVLALLARRLVDADTLQLVHLLLRSGGTVYRSALALATLGARCPQPGWGLPLGSWLSQWCGNLYLDGLDHFIKRQLTIPGYQRYMDDFVLFADDKTRLLDARAAIREWLLQERALHLNPRHLVVLPTHTPAVFLGYRISRAGITASRKLRRRLRQRLQAAAARGDAALLRTVRAYRGLLLFP